MEMVDVIATIETAKADFAERAKNLVTGLKIYGPVEVSYACQGIDFRLKGQLDGHEVEVFACHRKDGNKNIALGVSYEDQGEEWQTRYSEDDTWHGLAMVLIDLKRELS